MDLPVRTKREWDLKKIDKYLRFKKRWWVFAEWNISKDSFQHFLQLVPWKQTLSWWRAGWRFTGQFLRNGTWGAEKRRIGWNKNLNYSPVTIEVPVDPKWGLGFITALLSCSELRESSRRFAPGPTKQMWDMDCPWVNDWMRALSPSESNFREGVCLWAIGSQQQGK